MVHLPVAGRVRKNENRFVNALGTNLTSCFGWHWFLHTQFFNNLSH